ncbi:MAG: peptidoglycan editing factor PgeF [Deltaproteobacteria bacterium]|nr:peptidoglycan editing factor PgeF [Deltaproteobacteria bacterium]
MIPLKPVYHNGILRYPLDGCGAFTDEGASSAERPRVWAGTFNRMNGVSAAPYDSLNIGFHVGDDLSCVQQNREIIRRAVNANFLVSACQSHGDRIAHIDSYVPEDHLLNIDGLITRVRGLAIMIQHADCQAVGLYDPLKAVIANIHCGWRGCVNGIAGKAVQEMVKTYGTDPATLKAFISPSMGKCCGEFMAWQEIFPARFKAYMVKPAYFDLWSLTRDDLLNAGLSPDNIILSNICTVCSKEYFSYRREKNTGRCATVMVLH